MVRYCIINDNSPNAKKNSFDIIILKEVLLVSPDNADITQAILDDFDKAYLDNLAKEKAQETKPAVQPTSDTKDKTKK